MEAKVPRAIGILIATARLPGIPLYGALALTTFLFVSPQLHPLEAQSFRAGVGAAVPIGSSADMLDPGYSAMLSYALRSAKTPNAIRLEAAISSMAQKAPASGKLQLVSGTVNLIILGAQRAPTGYVVVGAGSYQQTGRGQRRSDPGVNLGAGIQFSLGFFGTFIEARLHYINDDKKTKFFPMVLGLTF